MICKKPFMAGTAPYGCGQCLPCRIARRKMWTTRQVLESFTHEHNSFVTLTYAPEHEPADGSVQPRALQLFVKRLRAAVAPHTFRFFSVGEYGDESSRPHYHLSLFGVSAYLIANGRVGVDHISRCWPFGFVDVQEFTRETAQYTCGYVIKKLTAKDDPRLAGRHPEFARMSNRPGIGALAIPTIAQSLVRASSLEVGRLVRIHGRKEYIGPYLLRLLTEARGFDEETIQTFKDQKSMERSVEMLRLFKAHETATEVPTPRKAFLASIHQKILTVEARNKIHSSRRRL